jgi:hypothetical protein
MCEHYFSRRNLTTLSFPVFAAVSAAKTPLEATSGGSHEMKEPRTWVNSGLLAS